MTPRSLVATFRATTRDRGLRVRAETSSAAAALYLYDVVGSDGWGGGISPKDVAGALDALRGAPVCVYINSPGGDVFDGVTIYNQLRRYGGAKTMVVDGLAASIASLLLMAGDDVRVAPAAQVMVHNPWSMVIGDAAEMRAMADLLDQTAGMLIEAYAEGTGQDPKQIKEWMAAETWMTANQAVANGFADSIDTPSQEPDGDEASGDQARARARLLVQQLAARLRNINQA